ncbi:MAG: heparinase II/III family protein [Oscillospiraceae bacterium]
MTAAYHTKYHKHCDDLSILVHKGGDILVEAGCNGFDYKDPMTRYSYSCFAHNTLVVDDASLPRVDGKYDCVYIEDGSTGDEASFVSAVNKRYHDTIHKRRADYYGKDYTIVDRYNGAPNPHNSQLPGISLADVDFIASSDGNISCGRQMHRRVAVRL